MVRRHTRGNVHGNGHGFQSDGPACSGQVVVDRQGAPMRTIVMVQYDLTRTAGSRRIPFGRRALCYDHVDHYDRRTYR